MANLQPGVLVTGILSTGSLSLKGDSVLQSLVGARPGAAHAGRYGRSRLPVLPSRYLIPKAYSHLA